MRRAAAVIPALLGLAPPEALAHAFMQRYDLPLPLNYYLAGAGLVVALSFVLAVLFMRPGASLLDKRIEISRTALWRCLQSGVTRRALQIASICLLLVLLGAGFMGVRGEPEQNLLPVTVWVLWWVGVTCICAIFGNVWRAINPWAALGELMFGNRQRVAFPDQGSAWIATGLFLAFAWMELAWIYNAVPPYLAWAIIAYSLITLAGMAVMGVPAWLNRGEAFSVFFGMVSRFAPLRHGVLRPYGAGLVEGPAPDVSRLAFILLMLSTVSFDGLKETPLWADSSAAAMDVLYRAGLLAVLGNVWATTLVKTAGLLLAPLLFFALYWLVCRLAAVMVTGAGGDSRFSAMDLARHFALSLLPIAIAYHFAHYFSYLLVQGQAAWPLISDPFDLGWNLFGTRGYEPDIGIVDARFVWNLCLVAVVLGHVVAVVVAHRRAFALFGERHLAARSQYPMLALMVAYTLFSLWVLSQPVVQHS